MIGAAMMTLAMNMGRAAEPPGPITEEERQARLERAASVGEHHLAWVGRFLDDNPRQPQGGIVFIGDSITEHFPLNTALPGLPVINRGIGGDMIPQLRSRLDTSVADLKPSMIYLKIGINDLWWGEYTPKGMVEGYDALLGEIREAAPEARLYVQSTLPTYGTGDELNRNVRKLNDSIVQLAEKHGASYIDLWPMMADESGSLHAEYTNDGVHLTLPGYLAWLNVIVPDGAYYLRVTRSLASRWRDEFTTEYPIAAVSPQGNQFPGGRGPDELIVYMPGEGRTTTGTNEWGIEVAVVNGVVLDGPRGNNSPIPSDGMIVSGHGKAAAWINTNLPAGTPLRIEDNKIIIDPIITGNLFLELWHAVAAMDARGADDSEWEQMVELLKILRQWHDSPTGEERDGLRARALEILEGLNPGRYS